MVALQEVSFQFYFLVKKFGKGISSSTTLYAERKDLIMYYILLLIRYQRMEFVYVRSLKNFLS